MESIQNNNMSLIEAKSLASQIKPEFVRCCPTMDLIAYVTAQERVEVFRFGGQLAYSLHRREPDAKVVSLCWKYNGKPEIS
jgi:anaphase-promoting complex subunit 4